MLHVVGKPVLGVSRRPPCLATGISMASLSILTTGQPASPRTSHPREQGTRGNVFYNLATQVTHHHIRHISLVTEKHPVMWESNKRMNSKRQESLGTILEAGFYYLKISFQMKDNAQYSFRTVYHSPFFFNFPSPHCMACRMLGFPKGDWTWALGSESRELSTGTPGNFILNMVIWDPTG